MREHRILDDPTRLLAIVRLAAIPVFVVGEQAISHPRVYDELFRASLTVASAYALVLATLAFRRPADPVPMRVTTPLDLLFLGVLTFSSGGSFSQLRYGFFVVPVATALLRGPRTTVIASAAALSCYLASTIPFPDTRANEFSFQLTNSVYLLWISLTATLLSATLTRRQRQVAELSAERGLLVARAIEAEERERSRLAEALHDDAIQNLLAARQSLGPDGRNVDASDLALVRTGLDRTVEQLRDAVFDLHPHLLRHAGLEAALTEVAARAPGDDVTWTVEVDEAAAATHAAAVFAIARELMTNAVKHAHAGAVDVVVARDGTGVRVTVADDGVGIDPVAARRAPVAGHVGLASCAERAEALGGRLDIASAPGEGARVDVRLPGPTGSGGDYAASAVSEPSVRR